MWNNLAQDKALHLLPPADACLGGAPAYLGPAPGGSDAWDPAFVGVVARSLVDGELDKALDGGGGGGRLAGQLALHVLAASLLDRRNWADGTAARRAREGPHQAAAAAAAATAAAEGAGGRPAAAAPSAAAVPPPQLLAVVVRGVSPELLARLVLAGEEQCGVGRREAAAVLVQTFASLPELLGRVRHALALLGLQ